MSAKPPKPESDHSLVDGASEAEAARKVKFEENLKRGPDEGADDDPPDAGDKLGSTGKPGVGDGPPAPDAIALEELTAENDDGAG